MEMLVAIDYQEIVNLLAKLVAVAAPIGLTFGICGKLYNAFMSMVFGKDKVNL